MSKRVLVTGITGKQGGAIAQSLRQKGHRVRGLSRNPKSDAGQALQKQGIEMVAGDFTKPDTLVEAMRGVDAVFAMTTPFEAGEQAETAQGIALVDAAVRAGTKHFVFTSVASADKNTKIPHFDSKHAVEKHLAATDLDWTVIAPVYFMENLFFPQSHDALRSGSFAMPLPSDRKLQQIALADIGAFGAHVIEQRDAFLGKRIDIAGDELTGDHCAKALSDALDRPINYAHIPMEVIRSFSEDFAIMYQWFIDVGYDVDIDDMRKRYPTVGWHRFADWAKKVVPPTV